MTQQQEQSDPDPIGSVSKRDYLRLLLAAMGVGALSTSTTEVSKAAHLTDAPYPNGAWGYSPIAGNGVGERPSIAEIDKAWSETYHHLFQDVDVGARYYAEKNDDVWDLLPIVWDGLDTPADADVPAGGVMIEQQESASAFRLLGIDDDASHRRVATVDWTETAFDQTTTLTFDTTAEHDGNIAEKGVHHEQPTGTDWAASDIVEKGYPSSDEGGSSLEAYWPLDEDSGTTANDVTGNNHNGTISGATINQPGILGTTGYNFDGIDDLVEVPHATALNPSRITVALWFNHNVNDNMVLLEKGNADGSGTPRRYRCLIRNQIGEHQVEFRVYDGSWNIAKTNTQPNLDQWYFFVGTYDGSNLKAYLNAVEGDTTAALSSMPTIDGEIHIGAGNAEGTATAHMDGEIDDVRGYSRALSQAEITELYEAAL